MPKITMIGAGSAVFAKNLLGDILQFPELTECHVSLMDIDEPRLLTSERMAHKLAEALDVNPTIEATADAERALDGADYVINMIQVGGYEPATVIDFEVPKKYGLRQTIGDTLGIGGIMRAIRTIPVMLEYGRIMERVCPDVMFLNYVNPMAMNTWAMLKATKIRTIGLCHSVQSSYRHLCTAVGVDPDQVNWTCAGINHLAFYLSLEHNGEDLYPRIKQKVASGEYRPEGDRVRLDVMLRIGYYITESSEHLAEYVPWFMKRDRPELIENYNVPLDEYPRRCERLNARWGQMKEDLESGKGFDKIRRSSEYGSGIIHSMETDTPRLIHGSVLNHGIIDNLPRGCCVEVACHVDKNGVQPMRVGSLPPQCAALDRTSINVQELTVEAALTGNREHIYHAALLDPHTAAELDPDQIYSLVDDLIEAHGEYIPPELRERRTPWNAARLQYLWMAPLKE